MENNLAIWQFLTKLNKELPCIPAKQLLSINPRILKTYTHTKTCILKILAVLFMIVKKCKQISGYQ